MRYLSTILVSTGLLFSFVLFNATAIAGSGHDHGHGHSHGSISSQEAVQKATEKVQQFVKVGKIDSGWATIKATNVEKKTFNGRSEWVVSFQNEKIKDASKRTLYVFFNMNGNYLATNYTGK